MNREDSISKRWSLITEALEKARQDWDQISHSSPSCAQETKNGDVPSQEWFRNQLKELARLLEQLNDDEKLGR